MLIPRALPVLYITALDVTTEPIPAVDTPVIGVLLMTAKLRAAPT